MKKKRSSTFAIVFSTVLSVIILGITSFFIYKTIVKEMVEVDNYITHISELNTRDMKLQQEMDQKFIYEEDYNKAYLYLVESAIPNYESLLKDAKEFKITYNDLKEINQLYIKSNELYLESLSDTQNALENGSEELSDLAYDKVIEADNLMVKHDTLLEKLAEENGIELEWE